MANDSSNKPKPRYNHGGTFENPCMLTTGQYLALKKSGLVEEEVILEEDSHLAKGTHLVKIGYWFIVSQPARIFMEVPSKEEIQKLRQGETRIIEPWKGE